MEHSLKMQTLRSPARALAWAVWKDIRLIILAAILLPAIIFSVAYLKLTKMGFASEENLQFSFGLCGLALPILVFTAVAVMSAYRRLTKEQSLSFEAFYRLPVHARTIVDCLIIPAAVACAPTVAFLGFVTHLSLGIRIPIGSCAVIAVVMSFCIFAFVWSRLLLPLWLPFGIYALSIVFGSINTYNRHVPFELSTLQQSLLLGIVPIAYLVVLGGLKLDRRDIRLNPRLLLTLLRPFNLLRTRLRIPSSPQGALVWYYWAQICTRLGVVIPPLIIPFLLVFFSVRFESPLSYTLGAMPIAVFCFFLTAGPMLSTIVPKGSAVFQHVRPVSCIVMARSRMKAEYLQALVGWIVTLFCLAFLYAAWFDFFRDPIYYRLMAFKLIALNSLYWLITAIPISLSVRYALMAMHIVLPPGRGISFVIRSTMFVGYVLIIFWAQRVGIRHLFEAAGWWLALAFIAFSVARPIRQAVRLGLISARWVRNSILLWSGTGMIWFMFLCLIVPFKEQPSCSIPLYLTLIVLMIQALPNYTLAAWRERHQ